MECISSNWHNAVCDANKIIQRTAFVNDWLSGLSAVSYASTNTEAVSSYAVSTVAQSAPNRRHSNRPDHFIMRWTFDNNRQRRLNNPNASEAIEMNTMGGMWPRTYRTTVGPLYTTTEFWNGCVMEECLYC